MKPVHRTGIVVLSLAAVVAILIAIAQVGKPAALPAPYRPVLAAWVSSPPPPPPAEVPGSPFASRSSTPVTLKYAQASYTSAGNQLLPKKTHDARPVHPPLAVTAGIHGTVILEATIDGEGHVGEPRILQSVPMLDQSAVDAVRQWSFEPTIVNGKPVPVTIRVTVDYTASM